MLPVGERYYSPFKSSEQSRKNPLCFGENATSSTGTWDQTWNISHQSHLWKKTCLLLPRAVDTCGDNSATWCFFKTLWGKSEIFLLTAHFWLQMSMHQSSQVKQSTGLEELVGHYQTKAHSPLSSVHLQSASGHDSFWRNWGNREGSFSFSYNGTLTAVH